MASMIASLANFGGTKMIDTSAPVFSIASTTVPNTGSSTSLSSLSLCDTVVPALRALTPPTICVPALSIRAVCVVRLAAGDALDDDLVVLAFRKIDMSHGFL